MIRQFFSVGALTLLSRLTGFFRDIVLGAVLGAGVMADAFVIAFRLPNHFRAIFGEGAFNAAYVPAYSQILETRGPVIARGFSSQIFTLLLASQLFLLGLAWGFTPFIVGLLAPGIVDDPQKMALAVTLTRITFPYLTCITLVTLHSATLNAHSHFAAAAFAPVLLNLSMLACLGLAFLFADPAHAASWGVTISGILQLALLMGAARRAGVLERLAWPRWSGDMRHFFGVLGPAVIGSAGVQIALFADTIIGSLLPTGGLSSIYYADRIYQLPIGVIGIAAGTVLLPEMSRRFAVGAEAEAFHAQNRSIALTLLLSAPFWIAFLVLPDLIMRAAFLRGNFTAADAEAAASVLKAYAIGLPAIVLIRSVVASFQAKGDTKTPMVVALLAVGANVAVKILLFGPMGAPGLALATAEGAWINLGLLVTLAMTRGWMKPDTFLFRILAMTGFAAAGLTVFAVLLHAPVTAMVQGIGWLADILTLALLGTGGILVYGLLMMAGFRLFNIPMPWRRDKNS